MNSNFKLEVGSAWCFSSFSFLPYFLPAFTSLSGLVGFNRNRMGQAVIAALQRKILRHKRHNHGHGLRDVKP